MIGLMFKLVNSIFAREVHASIDPTQAVDGVPFLDLFWRMIGVMSMGLKWTCAH
jgi:hypothetical protein